MPICTSSFAAEFPLEALPPHITLDLSRGERPDWAPTGSNSYIFVDAPGGEPFEKDRVTGEVRSILPPGCEDCRVWRAYYLPNRDYLMTIGPARDHATIHIVDQGLEIPVWDMGVVAHEGVAVSRHSFQLAWTDGADIHYGELVYGNEGVPTLENQRVILLTAMPITMNPRVFFLMANTRWWSATCFCRLASTRRFSTSIA